MTTSPYRLVTTNKKDGSFDYSVVEVATGKVIGTRNSFRVYKSATVVRSKLSYVLRTTKADFEYASRAGSGYSDDQVARFAQAYKDAVAVADEGRQNAAGVLSFNSKATPLTSQQADYLDFLGFALAAPEVD